MFNERTERRHLGAVLKMNAIHRFEIRQDAARRIVDRSGVNPPQERALRTAPHEQLPKNTDIKRHLFAPF